MMEQKEIFDPMLQVWGVPDEYNIMYSADGKRVVGCCNCLLEEYTVREGCETIAHNAFQNCFGLRRIILPNGLKRIGNSAFKGCTRLQNIEIPDSVTHIGHQAFAQCIQLGQITLPESLQRLEAGCFIYSGIRTVESRSRNFECWNGLVTDVAAGKLVVYVSSANSCAVPEGIRHIGHMAFTGHNELHTVQIPSTVVRITGNPFFGSGVKNCESHSEHYVMQGDFLIEKEKNRLVAWTGEDSSVHVPQGIRTIGNGAFFGKQTLERVTLPDSVVRIGDRAFLECGGLKDFTPSASLTVIGREAFSGCKQLRPFPIPEGVTAIKDWAFNMCKSWDDGQALLPKGLKTLGAWCFAYCEKITDLNLPYGVESIGNYAFANCTGLESANVPASVTHIGRNAFLFCRSLRHIALPACATDHSRILTNCGNVEKIEYNLN